VEADLLRFYGLDLWRHLEGPRLTWHRLGVLLASLPAESATYRALHPEAKWSDSEHLLAALLDATHLSIWQRGGNPKAPQPTLTPRPGASPAPDDGRVTTLTNDEIADRLTAVRKQRKG